MSFDTPDTESPQPTPEPAIPTPTTRRRGILSGALLGAVALTASVVGVSAIASAQDDPEVDDAESAEVQEVDETDLDDTEFAEAELDGEIVLDDFDDPAWAAFDECITNALGSIDEDGGEADLTEEQWEALESQFDEAEAACDDLLPEDVKNEIAAWQPYEDCFESQIGDVESGEFDESMELSDEDMTALDDAWMAADEACFDLLPEEAKADAEAFKAYDQCLTDAGFGDDFGTVVYVEDGESGQSIQFGESAGTVTITGDSSGVSVATDGDVSVIDDSTLAACDELLPEDLFEYDEAFEGDLDEGEADLEEDSEEDDEDNEDDDA